MLHKLPNKRVSNKREVKPGVDRIKPIKEPARPVSSKAPVVDISKYNEEQYNKIKSGELMPKEHLGQLPGKFRKALEETLRRMKDEDPFRFKQIVDNLKAKQEKQGK